MKRYKLLKWIPVVLFILTPACSDDFLDVDPAGRLSTEIYPETDDEVYSAMIGGYDLMQWNYGRDWSSAFFVKNLPADDCNAGGPNDSDQPPYQNLGDFSNQADNAATTAVWEGFYYTINHCNTIIHSIEADNQFREQIIAEATAMRAWNYFELVTLFGDVPFYTENPASENEFHKPRTPKSEIYAQLETDLQDAIEDLPLKSELAEDQRFRISKGTAMAILGKIYLYQEKWSQAHGVLSDVISSEEYDLEEDYADTWRRSGEFGEESLFEIQYTSHEGYDWGNFEWAGEAEANIHVQLMGPRTDQHWADVDAVGMVPGWGFNKPTADLGDSFKDMGDDGPRYQNTLISQQELFDAGVSFHPDDDSASIYDYEGYLRMKYGNFETETNASDGAVADLNYTTNWRLIRYSDVLLMAAEAYNEDGDQESALTELNKVRERAELDPYESMGQGALREAIKEERKLELALEGSRYWDLIRWGDAADELSHLGFESGKHEHFPVPETEISANNEISQEDQNPGF
ncbi:MAG: RagB/SusD family nutrient uptake outer membrane protein [Marinilabilia sp.]